MDAVDLGSGVRVSRIARGNWQLAERHGPGFDRERVIHDMREFVDAGITLFDCADHYVGVEELLGEFRRRFPGHADQLRISTKIVPDQALLPRLKRSEVQKIVDRSLARLGVERLDLAQFHWWDYRVPGYVEAMNWLKDLQAAGKIALLGTTNFDTQRLREIVESGVPVATQQLQYSVLDRRPELAMAGYCAQRGIRLLCYGVLAGGFIGKRWLGAGPPQEPFANRSLTKYRLIIEEFGGWERFQALLEVLDRIGARRGASLSAVATRYVLDKPGAPIVILGVRDAGHLPGTLQIARLQLEDGERKEIARLADAAPGPLGDCYELERVEDGVHSRIMWKNQNTKGAEAK